MDVFNQQTAGNLGGGGAPVLTEAGCSSLSLSEAFAGRL